MAAAASAVVIASAPRPAHALDDDFVMVSPGVSFTVAFGRTIEVGVTIDLRVTMLLDGRIDQCTSRSRAGVGAYGQAGWFSTTGWRFGTGLHGGREFAGNLLAGDGEVGWVYQSRYDRMPGSHGLHLGLIPEFVPIDFPLGPSIQMPMAGEIPIAAPQRGPAFLLGAGIRLPPIFGFQQSCVIGRPLRDRDDIILPGVVRGCRRTPRLPRHEAAGALANAWLDDARAECASIPAFMALSRDLRAAGAPADLVELARAAARDEVRHTWLCAEIAGGFAGLELAPLLPSPSPRREEDRAARFRRLAVEAWNDGCLGEGSAAARAALAAKSASDEITRQALVVIAADEARHADLAWRVLEFALDAGGSDVREAIAEHVLAQAAEPPVGEAEHDADATVLRAHGRLSANEEEAAWHKTISSARARARHLLHC